MSNEPLIIFIFLS